MNPPNWGNCNPWKKENEAKVLFLTTVENRLRCSSVKAVDTRNPATWVRFKPSLCKGCQAGCCTMPVKVDAEDLFHMGYLTLYEVNGPLKRIAKRLMKAGIVRSYRDSNRIFTLERKNGWDCIFLGADRLCTIYDRRPYVCRQFPSGGARPGYCPSQRKSKVPIKSL